MVAVVEERYLALGSFMRQLVLLPKWTIHLPHQMELREHVLPIPLQSATIPLPMPFYTP